MLGLSFTEPSRSAGYCQILYPQSALIANCSPIDTNGHVRHT